MKPHKRKGRAALRKRREAAKSRQLVPITYEEAYQLTEGFRYRQNDLLKSMLDGEPFVV